MTPSLNAIKAFEAAARHLGFARAARDLGVQPPAVSRQVAELEQTLGVSLFVRSKPRLTLTPAGQELYLSVSIGLNEIRSACERLRRAGPASGLHVVTSIGFASCWLLARLPDFYRAHPDVDLQLSTRDSTTDLDPGDADAAVVFGGGDWPGSEQTTLFLDTMLAVCNPALLENRAPLKPDELAARTLLHYAEPSHLDDWRRLLAVAGLVPSPPASGTLFNSYMVYLQAALSGSGIAIGWERLLQDYLARGDLLPACDLRLPTRQGYACCLTEHGRDNPAAQRFRDWIVAAAARSAA